MRFQVQRLVPAVVLTVHVRRVQIEERRVGARVTYDGCKMPHKEPKSTGRYYRPELDLLRCVAFFMVFVHHAFGNVSQPLVKSIAAACGTGVQVFFLLSAYLITELLLREQEQTSTIHLRAFYVRRILRIWPLYFVFLGFAFLLAHTVHLGTFTVRALVMFLLLAGNWWVHFYGWLPNVAGPMWSIAVEEQFYLVWPFVVRFGGRRAVAWCSGLFLLIGCGTALYIGRHVPVPRYSYWTNSFLEFGFFAGGSILALLFHHKETNVLLWKRTLYLLTGIALIAACCKWFSLAGEAITRPYDLLVAFPLLTLGVMLIFCAVLGMHVPKIAKPFVELGRLSYGLYVFHYGCLSLGMKVLYHSHDVGRDMTSASRIGLFALVLTLILAFASYRFVELPFLRLKQRFTFVKSRVD